LLLKKCEKKVDQLLIAIQKMACDFSVRQFLKRMTEKDVVIRILQRNIRVYIAFKKLELVEIVYESQIHVLEDDKWNWI